MADITVAPGATYDTSIDWGVTGLAGTIGIRLLDGNGATSVARATAGIREYPAGSGRYEYTRTAPATQGDYQEFWDDGSVAPGHGANGDSVTVTHARALPSAPSGRDLCTLDDVTSYVPAYDADDTTDAKLQQLITAQSLLIMNECGREIISAGDSDPRLYDISRREAYTGRIPIDDCTEIAAAVLLAADGTVAETIDVSTLVMLYGVDRQPSEPWEPITAVAFRSPLGAPALVCGQTLQLTGSWGFPDIPAFVREACAARVILRYVSDVASSGDAFSEAVAEDALNLGALFRSSTEAVARLQRFVAA